MTGGMVAERPAPLAAEEETTSGVCRVLAVEPVRGDKLIALASVELVIQRLRDPRAGTGQPTSPSDEPGGDQAGEAPPHATS